MLSRVIPFRKKVGIVGWCPDELAECYRVVGLLARSGLPVSIDSGLTDEGEPWAIVLREDTGDVLLHMARLDGAFVVVSATSSVAQHGESLRAVLDAAVRTGGLAMLTRQSAAADSDILRLHPATLIAALIAGAWVSTQTGQADLLETGARREDRSGTSRTDDARAVGFAAQPASATLVTAATSFAAVAAALHVTQTDPILEMTAEDFIQAALELVAEAPVGTAPLNVGSIEFVNLQLKQDAPPISSATMDQLPPAQAPPGDAHMIIRLEAGISPVLMTVFSAGDTLRAFAQQQSGTPSPDLEWRVADKDMLNIGSADIAFFVQPAQVKSLGVALFSSLADGLSSTTRPAAQTVASVQPAIVTDRSSMLKKEDVSAVKAIFPIIVEKVDLQFAYLKDPLAIIFKSAAQILHLNPVVNLTAAAASGSPDIRIGDLPDAWGVASTAGSVAADTGGSLPSTTKSVSPLASSTQFATLPRAEVSGSDVSGESRPSITMVQPAPLSNAHLLLEFTNRTEHVVRVDRDGLTGPLTGPFSGSLETGDAHRVVVFDAPWLNVKSFMLMPGVIMIEDDALGGVNRAGMEMKGQHVSLDLGGGLTLTLLGVIDLGPV